MQRMNVFFSHLTLERKLAEILRNAVTRDFIGLINFFVSSDTFSIPVGDKWAGKMIEGLGNSDLHMVLCSPESVNRPWINFETGAACLRNIPIVPVCHSGLQPHQLPSPLSQFESVVASDEEGLEKLYTKIASMLGAFTPNSRLSELADEVRAFEAEYQALSADAAKCEITASSIATLRSPRVLCVTSKQFVSLRSADFDIIQKAFPETTSHRREVTSQAVSDILLHEHFDIVHVATYVCPKTGDLVFSDVDLDSAERTCQPADVLTGPAFVSLIKGAHTKLVVIASCESFELGAQLLSVAEVIATRDIVSFAMFAAWIGSFYQALQSMTLSEAFDYSVKASRAPMKLYARQDMVVSHSSGRAARMIGA